MIEQGVEGGLWHLEKSFESRLIVTNVLRDTPITVTPFLYMADGTEYRLPDLYIGKAAVASVDINRALAQAPASIRLHASSYGTAGIRYAWRGVGAVMASMQSLDEIDRVNYVSHLQSSRVKVHKLLEKPGPQVIEGLWWKQYAEVGGFLSVSNMALQPMSATLDLLDATGSPFAAKALSLSPHQTVLLDLGALLAGTKSTEGGIRIAWNGVPWAITAQAGIEDDATGYSAVLPLTEFPATDPPNPPPTAAYESTGLMLGAQDPRMNFPENTTFQVYDAMRNLTGHALPVTVSATYQSGGSPATATLGTFTLAAHGSRQLDMPALLRAAGVPADGEVNLRTSFPGRYNDLMIATGSYDRTRDFVFEVAPTIERATGARILCYWQALNDTSTMISLWNYTARAQDFVVTFYWDGGSYAYPMTLRAGESNTIDLGRLVHNQVPDRNGKTIPEYVHEGRATLSGPGDVTDQFEVAASVSTYNVRNATCGVECSTCDGVTNAWIEATAFSLALTRSAGVTTWVELQDGTSEEWNASYSAGSHLNMAGNTVTAVSVGSSDVSSVLSGIYGAGEECQGTPSPVDCSSWAPPSPAPSQVNVPPMVTFSPLTAVLAGGSAQVVVSFSNGATSSPVPITLTLKTTSGTGAAGFAGAGPTMTITKPTTVTITGLTPSSTANNIKLDATIPGMESSGTQEDAVNPQAFTVQKPTSLSASASSAPFSCTSMNASLRYTTQEALITYNVLDQFGNPIQIYGIPVAESFSAVSNSCSGVPSTPTATSGQTNANGIFGPDTLAMCSSSCLPANGSGQPTGACTYQVTQTWKANNSSVQTKTITYTCAGPPTLH